MRVVGEGVVKFWTGVYWAVDNGACNVYIRPEHFIGCQPAEGLAGILTYEHHPKLVSCVNCFRPYDDPDVRNIRPRRHLLTR